MKNSKQVLTGLLFPHIALVVILAVISAAGLIYSFIGVNVNLIIQITFYVLSAYALTIVSIRCFKVIQKLNRYRKANLYYIKYRSNKKLQIKISLYMSVSINFIYSASHFTMGIFYHSIWFYALSAYYFLLIIMRFFLLRETYKIGILENKKQEYRCYRLCGIALLLMNIILSVVVFYIVWRNKGFAYHYIMTIAMATYTFATFTKAIVSMWQYKKYNSPIISAAKQISFAAALVSMLSLETAMLTAFGNNDNLAFNRIMTACTGASVCIMILGLAIYMIVHSTKCIKREMP